jgi:uncharacterized protein
LGLIYLDSCICIYLIERSEGFYPAVSAAFANDNDGDYSISPLVIAECLAGAFKSDRHALVNRFEVFFQTVTVLDLTEFTYRNAALIVGQTGLKLPDALHLACARQYNCVQLWTNDRRLSDLSGGFAKAIV